MCEIINICGRNLRFVFLCEVFGGWRPLSCVLAASLQRFFSAEFCLKLSRMLYFLLQKNGRDLCFSRWGWRWWCQGVRTRARAASVRHHCAAYCRRRRRRRRPTPPPPGIAAPHPQKLHLATCTMCSLLSTTLPLVTFFPP